MKLIIFTIVVSMILGFSISFYIITKYLKDSNDYGNDFGEIYDAIQSSLKITEKKDKIQKP
ncbi:MAG: hypothetical protein IJ232_09555 [Lachnospiraceae bacterium]|nr:hypothetical protein [Lachnospiraceae bacterium]